MLLSPRKDGLNSLFKEVRVLKVFGFLGGGGAEVPILFLWACGFCCDFSWANISQGSAGIL